MAQDRYKQVVSHPLVVHLRKHGGGVSSYGGIPGTETRQESILV